MTRETLVQLGRELEFQRLPCVGEWLRIDGGGLLPFEITEVEHDEHGRARITLGPQADHTGELLFHESEENLQADVKELVGKGWTILSQKPNNYWGRRTRRKGPA